MKRKSKFKLGRSKAKGNSPYCKKSKGRYLYSWEKSLKKKEET